MNKDFILKVTTGRFHFMIATLMRLSDCPECPIRDTQAYVWFSELMYLQHGRMLAFHCNQICGLRLDGGTYLDGKKRTCLTPWKKLDLLEFYYYPRWENRCVFELNLCKILRSSALLSPFLQVKSSSGCHPHVNLVKEEEKCIKDLLLLKSHKVTGELIQFLNCIF